MKPTFRACMAWLHTWSGLTMGWLLLAMTLAGTLSVFRPEINTWMRPELRTPSTVNPDMATQTAIQWLSVHAAKSPTWYLEAANARAPYVQALWLEGDAYQDHALDPQTGSPSPLRDTRGGDFFYRFHFELQLPYPWGRLIAAVAAMALVLILLTGIIAHKRIFLDFFTFRPNKGQRSWLDAHNLLGVAALPFHLMIAFTGALTLANMLMPWGLTTLYHQDFSALEHDFNPAGIERPASGKAGTLAPIGPVLADINHRFAPNRLIRLTISNPSDAASVIQAIAAPSASGVGVETHTLSYDGTTGTLLAEHKESRPIMGFYRFLYGLHVAHFAPVFTRWLYFLSGLGLAGVIATGLHLWTSKRCQRHRGFGFRLVERVNVGMIGGIPTAFACFFLANRLLPPSLATRAQIEVQTVFCVWAILLLYAAVRPATVAWRDLLGMATLACLGVALLNGLPVTPLQIGVGVTAFSLTCLFSYATWRMACAAKEKS
ncbi:hypothetical protein ASN_108 [Acetobacter senegalensis]|uniref:PepSY domain-containing protein n=1 Tax=Acetobacter senegalensis TaxID=446692 RepID=A0A0U5EQE5_9PROT|nr:PepSY-associated TM helix domain-containing protein [Acetobacter senegalensis]CEF39556.1 hypothetical protein ASN_108 [Acetobacter senegalensis]